MSILLFLVTVSATALSVYFSALTAYGIHAYDFKLKKAAWGMDGAPYTPTKASRLVSKPS